MGIGRASGAAPREGVGRRAALRWRTAAGWAFALALVALACGSPRKMTRVTGTPQELRPRAEHATAIGDWRAAADHWWTIHLAEDGRDPRAAAEAARALVRLGDAESACNVLDLGLSKHPRNAELHELKGDALVAQRFRRAAEGCYERAVELDPERRSALLSLARVRIDLGYERAAVAPLERALQLGAGDLDTCLLLAHARRKSDDVVGAYEAYARAFELGQPDLQVLLDAARLFMDERVGKRHPDAAEVCAAWLQRAVATDPQLTAGHFQLGVLYEEIGREAEAIAAYRRAVETDPSCLMALRNLAVLYAARGDDDNTREMVLRALELEKDPERRMALVRLMEPMAARGNKAREP